MTPVEALAAALHKAWPIRVKGKSVGNDLAAATILAALDGWTLVPNSDLARLREIEEAVDEAHTYLDDMGMVYTDDGEWTVPSAGYEKFGWAMDLLAGLVGEAVAPPNANTAPAPQPQPQQAPATSTPPEPPDANFETDYAFRGWVPGNPPPEERG